MARNPLSIKVIGATTTANYLRKVAIKLPKSARDYMSRRIAERAARTARGILSKAPYKDRRGGLLARNIRVFPTNKGWYMIASAMDDYGYDYAIAVARGTNPPKVINNIPNNPMWRGRMHPGAHSTGPKRTLNFDIRAKEAAVMAMPGIIETELIKTLK